MSHVLPLQYANNVVRQCNEVLYDVVECYFEEGVCNTMCERHLGAFFFNAY